MSQLPPPQDADELLRRAHALAGTTLGQLARRLGRRLPTDPRRAKGLAGELAELALGASAGNTDQPDFPQLGIELKTIPMDAEGRVRESTHVCAIDHTTVQREEWESSRVQRKLSRVLWLPVEWAPGRPPAGRHFGQAVLWKPSAEELSLLRADWLQLMGRMAVGGIEEVTAHMGQALQVRPKAKSAAVQVEVFGPDSQPLRTVPRGFYLRASFTEAVLWRCTG